MKAWLLTAVLVTVGLAGCSKAPSEPVTTHGRYIGIGIYPAGDLWSKIADDGNRSDAASAKMTDDQQVIVVIDSQTGEVRQCGNLTGYCIDMQPWTKPLTATQTSPVRLTSHASATPAATH